VARLLPLCLIALLAAGCGGDDRGEMAHPPADSTRTSSAPPPAPKPKPKRPSLARATCPPGAGNCRSAIGRVIYVEKVDPDGDGDAHFVLAGKDNVTGEGLSVIDVRRDLRPRPLPGFGDLVTAAGPVYLGSHGQKQIQAEVVRAQRR
jgi:hypothetical protein